MGKSPQWVMDTMSPDQAALVFSKLTKQKVGESELLAGIIWAMATGDYKKSNKFSASEAKQTGFYEEK